MQMPMIHLNGSDRDTLAQQYIDAVYAMNDAIATVRQIDVNGRDYYPISDDASSIARKEHQARINALENIWRELTAIAVHVDP